MYKMTSVKMNTASTKVDEKGDNMLSPSEEDSRPVLKDTSAPLDFSHLIPSQFGISVQSFTPASLSNCKDKSRLAQIKARRRSNVGVRGSPETNSLIRFIAQQRMKTPPASQTPELVRSSPFLPRVASTLRQKMASFQSMMDVEESEVSDPMPRQDSNTGGCIKTRDYLSDGNSHYGGKENHPPMRTPIPTKRRRLGPIEGCQVEIREASAPLLHFSLKEQEEDEEPVMQVVTQGPLPSENVEEAQAVLISPTLHTDLELQACSPAQNQQGGAFELQGLGRAPPDDPAATSPAQPASPFHMPSLPSLLEMKHTEDEDCTGPSTVKKMKKRVHFGGPLSPEFFDKFLPPSTPLQKGGTPARAPTPCRSLGPRSVLKTPQRSESQTPQAQPDLSSPTVFGASPTLPMPRNRTMQPVGEDGEEKNKQRMIVFPSMEEIDSVVTSGAECTWDAQPLNLNAAFREEALCQTLPADKVSTSVMPTVETKPSSSLMDALDEPASLPEKEKQHEAAPAQSTNAREKKPEAEHASSSKAAARSSSRKRKQPEESDPPKRSTRSAARSASGKMKRTATATQRWKKDVDHSLYGSRTYASKDPTLSPITETLSLIRDTVCPAAQQIPSTSCTAVLPSGPNHETCLNPEMDKDTHVIGDLTVANALENASEDLVTSPNSRRDCTTGKGRRLSGPRTRRRGLKKKKVIIADDALLSEETLSQIGGKTEEHCEDQTTTNLEASSKSPQKHSVHEHNAHNTADTETHCHGNSDCHGGLDAPTSDCQPSGEDSNNTLRLPAERKAKRGRRCSVNSSMVQKQGNPGEEHQTSHDEEEKGRGDQAASQQENHVRTSSASQEERGVAHLGLAPWQSDFNFEDVFKPVATRGQRSVRRSLRNQSNAEQSNSGVGLAWLAWTSPASNKEARRRTQAQRLSAVQPCLPEETKDEAS